MRATLVVLVVGLAVLGGCAGKPREPVPADCATIPSPPEPDPQPQAIASAGPDVDARTGDTVTLDGSRSANLGNATMHYVWAQVAGPCVTLHGDHAQTATFTAPQTEQGRHVLTFRLVVESGGRWSPADTTDVTVSD